MLACCSFRRRRFCAKRTYRAKRPVELGGCPSPAVVGSSDDIVEETGGSDDRIEALEA